MLGDLLTASSPVSQQDDDDHDHNDPEAKEEAESKTLVHRVLTRMFELQFDWTTSA
jgi:hypothetical protein